MPNLDPEGTAYLDAATGTLYRLRDYRADWEAEPFTGERTVPSYVVHYAAGASSTTSVLPDGVQVVWTPTNRSTENKSQEG